MMNQMMKGMMNNCCDSEGKPNFEKMENFMEDCGCGCLPSPMSGSQKTGEPSTNKEATCGSEKA